MTLRALLGGLLVGLGILFLFTEFAAYVACATHSCIMPGTTITYGGIDGAIFFIVGMVLMISGGVSIGKNGRIALSLLLVTFLVTPFYGILPGLVFLVGGTTAFLWKPSAGLGDPSIYQTEPTKTGFQKEVRDEGVHLIYPPKRIAGELKWPCSCGRSFFDSSEAYAHYNANISNSKMAPEVREKIISTYHTVTREVLKIPCKYCGTLGDPMREKTCSQCGASMFKR